ncbi:DUF1361 domain-containing protein [Aquimarina sp. 2201CG1-2-11]|uniref:DUF1361 domain-containing protein n=1 Tax=Aquimarina discodermiae TaxID=3231043 RepID=UPI0034632379
MNTANKPHYFIKEHSIAIAFSFALLLIRYLKTDSFFYLFLVWNLFLACIPYLISIIATFKKGNRFIFWSCFIIWLLFLPNSPYILTDFQHIRTSTISSIWFDVLLILSFAINGLLIGFSSLHIMQSMMNERFSKKVTNYMIYIVLLLCGFGIYLGRVLRWNSWDILQDPIGLLSDIAKRILFPTQHIETWVFTLGFGTFLILTYQRLYALKKSI